MWLFFMLLLVIVCAWDWYRKRSVNQNQLKCIPGPKITLPIIGDSLLFVGVDTTNFFHLLQTFREKYGRICRLWLFQHLFVVIQDAKYAESLLIHSRNIRKNFLYDMLSPWLGDGLLLSFGTKWHMKRKIITPTFHFKILEQFIEIFDRNAERFVQELDRINADERSINGDCKEALLSINVYPLINLSALDTIAETAMGVTINALEQPDLPYVKALASGTEIIANRVVKPAQYSNLVYTLVNYKEKQRFLENAKLMHEFTDRVIQERHQMLQDQKELIGQEQNTNEHEQSIESADVNIVSREKTRLAFLDLLLQSTWPNGKPLSNADIREEVDTFMFEGHDTTTSGLSHAIYLLSRHPEAQQKAYKEIRAVMGEKKSLTMTDLQEFKYLECVIKETLRLYPSVPMISRIIEEDFKMGDNIIPAGTNVMVALYAISRDPQYFEQPDEFIPERFMSSNNLDRKNSFAFVPFSAGPRNCIGQKFAMLEMKTFLYKLLNNYELLGQGPDIVPVMNLILRSTTGVHVGFKRRIVHEKQF